jgi:hypothetical protein
MTPLEFQAHWGLNLGEGGLSIQIAKPISGPGKNAKFASQTLFSANQNWQTTQLTW